MCHAKTDTYYFSLDGCGITAEGTLYGLQQTLESYKRKGIVVLDVRVSQSTLRVTLTSEEYFA